MVVLSPLDPTSLGCLLSRFVLAELAVEPSVFLCFLWELNNLSCLKNSSNIFTLWLRVPLRAFPDLAISFRPIEMLRKEKGGDFALKTTYLLKTAAGAGWVVGLNFISHTSPFFLLEGAFRWGPDKSSFMINIGTSSCFNNECQAG